MTETLPPIQWHPAYQYLRDQLRRQQQAGNRLPDLSDFADQCHTTDRLHDRNGITREKSMGIVVKPPPPTSTASVIPSGVYHAKLSDIRQFENTYGPRIGFEFTIEGGDSDGEKVMRSTSANLTRQSKLADMIRMLQGSLSDEELAVGVDIEELIGTHCKVLVSQSQGRNGHVYSNVDQVFR